MIYGIGTDIVNINRIKYILEKNERAFIQKILTQHEQQLFKNYAKSPAFVAKRFAAKEAFAKAFGTGIGSNISFLDLTITNNDSGKPFFIISEKLRLKLINKNIKNAFLTLSDEKEYATAFVILELNNNK